MAKSSKFVSRSGHTLEDITHHLRRSCRAVDEQTARGLVNYLVVAGAIKVIGEHGVAGQRGRRAYVFDWSPEQIATHFANIGVPARESWTTPPAEKRVPAAPKAAQVAGAAAVDATVAALVDQAGGLVVANLSPVSTDLTVAADVVTAIEAGPETAELPADVASLADAITAE